MECDMNETCFMNETPLNKETNHKESTPPLAFHAIQDMDKSPLETSTSHPRSLAHEYMFQFPMA